MLFYNCVPNDLMQGQLTDHLFTNIPMICKKGF